MKTLTKPQEGDYIESEESIIFAVKGAIHPPNRIIAFPKYIPNPKGSRSKGKRKYLRINSLKGAYNLLEKRHPDYLCYDHIFQSPLSEVPYKKVIEHYQPKQALRRLADKEPAKLDTVEKDALDFAAFLTENCEIPKNNIGISGSIMAGLHTPNSDIDVIIYGSTTCHTAYMHLKELMADKTSHIHPYNVAELKRLYRRRSVDTAISLKDSLKIETGKLLQGKFRNREYFIRMLKTPHEMGEKYGDRNYTPMGSVELTAEVADDSEAIFTPCIYKIKKVAVRDSVINKKIEEIVSFRGRFCEQARKGERIFARGQLEMVSAIDERYYRVLAGNRPEDYLQPLNLERRQ